jgi:hypothetical protein
MNHKIIQIDSLTQAGHPDVQNEDRYGLSDKIAFVIDGATGLTKQAKDFGGLSEPAWLAERAAQSFLSVGEEIQDVKSAVIEISKIVQNHYPNPDEQPPVASFISVDIVRDNLLTLHALGDCTAILADEDGVFFCEDVSSPTSRMEWIYAQRDYNRGARFNEKGRMTGDAEFDRIMLERRANQNKPSSDIWTLSKYPEAVDHFVTRDFPIKGKITGLLCTDGVFRLCDMFNLISPNELLYHAQHKGLNYIFDMLRYIEHDLDPQGDIFPRYKRSDDATALLFEVN